MNARVHFPFVDVPSEELREAYIAVGLIRPALDDDPVTPFTPTTLGPVLKMDAYAHRLAARRVANYHQHGPAWDDFALSGVSMQHQWDKETELVCERCGCYAPFAGEVCE